MVPPSRLFVTVILCVLSAQQGVTNSCDHCPTRPLCLRYTLTDTTCGGNLTANGINVTINDPDSQVQQIRIFLNGSVFELSENVSCDVRVIHEVCEGAELFSLEKLPVENSTYCSSTINRMNEIVINCDGEKLNPHGAEMGIFVTDCFDNCTDSIYVVEYTDCSCGVEWRVAGMQETGTLWDKCSVVDIGRVQPQRNEECLRQRCMRFLDVACSCCSINCESNPYYSVHASAVCPTHLKANCTVSGDLCGTSCSLECNGKHEKFCQGVCKNPFQNISSSLIMSEVKEYCVGQINQNCSDLILSDINCSVTPVKCARICQKDEVVGFFAEGCLTEVLQFCETFIDDLLLLTEDDYQMYIGTVRTFVRQMLPSTVVNKLQSLFNAPTGKDLLTIPNHAEMLLDVYDSLFDDELNSSLASSHETISTVLHQLNTLAKLIGEDFLERRRTAPFTILKNNLIFSVRAPNRTEEVNNTHIFTIEGYGSLDNFTADVKISTDLLCQKRVKRCSSAIAFVVVNNMADYLHNSLINQGDTFARNYKTGSELLSIQVVGVQNLSKLLSESKMKIIFPLQRHFSRVRCISTSNQSQYTWSGNGVFTGRLNSQTIRCSSNHTGSFAVLLTNDPYIVHEIAPPDGVITIISHVSSMVSIVSLLATIICLIIFRKILNNRSLVYVHLNLAIALMLGLLFLIVAIDNVHFKGLRDIVPLCMIVAVVTHYFLLAAFFWMLCEGIMLYILLVRVFGNATEKWYWLLIIGWGLPFLIVLISAAVLQENYIAPRSFLFENCWLNPGFTQAAYWTFTGPMIVVILINTVILVLSLINIVRVKKQGRAGTSAEVKNRTLVVTAIKGTVVLLPLLGITWGIGLFGAVYNQYPVFAWIFVFLNNFQGLFIFIFHVLRNRAVRRKLKQICCVVIGRRSEATGSSELSNKRETRIVNVGSRTKSVSPHSSASLLSSNENECNQSTTIEIEVGSQFLASKFKDGISEEISNNSVMHP